MYDINEDLKKEVENLNIQMKDKYIKAFKSNIDIKELLEEYIGKIKKIDKLSKKELNEIQENGGIVGVDGSVNKKGGASPHYIELYQGLAKSTIYNENPIYKSKLYSPILEEDNIDEEFNKEIDLDLNVRNKNLAEIEVEVALEAAKEHRPYAILMDGGLIRYNIEAGDIWGELVNYCVSNNIVLVGVIKDIKTSLISKELGKNGILDYLSFYDREILFGELEYLDAILINDEVNTKDPEGYSSVFIRSSKAPNIIGMDIIDVQKDKLEEMTRLIASLTPENSRGVPLWLDMVDKEVKISDKMMEALLEECLDRDIYERFFISERDKRS